MFIEYAEERGRSYALHVLSQDRQAVLDQIGRTRDPRRLLQLRGQLRILDRALARHTGATTRSLEQATALTSDRGPAPLTTDDLVEGARRIVARRRVRVGPLTRKAFRRSPGGNR
jgi:hypothetical protein